MTVPVDKDIVFVTQVVILYFVASVIILPALFVFCCMPCCGITACVCHARKKKTQSYLDRLVFHTAARLYWFLKKKKDANNYSYFVILGKRAPLVYPYYLLMMSTNIGFYALYSLIVDSLTIQYGEDYGTEDYETEDYGTEDYGTEDYGTEDYGTEDYETEDYGTEDYGTEDYGTEDYGTEDYETEDYGTEDYGTEDYGTEDYGTEDYETEDYGTEDYGTEDYGTEDYGTEDYGTEDYGTEDYGTEDYGTEDYETEDYGTEDYGTEDYGTEDYGTEDYETEDYGTEDYGTEDYGTEDYGTEDYENETYYLDYIYFYQRCQPENFCIEITFLDGIEGAIAVFSLCAFTFAITTYTLLKCTNCLTKKKSCAFKCCTYPFVLIIQIFFFLSPIVLYYYYLIGEGGFYSLVFENGTVQDYYNNDEDDSTSNSHFDYNSLLAFCAILESIAMSMLTPWYWFEEDDESNYNVARKPVTKTDKFVGSPMMY